MIQEYHFWVSIYLYLYLYLYLSIAPKMKAGTSTDTCTPTFLSSLLHSSQKVESNQVSVDGWTDKQNTGHTCNAILFNLNKDGNADVSYHMDEPWGQQAKWNRPIKEASTLRSHSQEVPAVGPLRDRKQNRGCQGWGRGVTDYLIVAVWNDEKVLEMDSTYCHWTVYVKMANFPLRTFYHNKKRSD